MDLAEKITGPLEEALTVAFSQVHPSPRQDRGVPRDRVIHMSLNKVGLGPSFCQLCDSGQSGDTLSFSIPSSEAISWM